MESLAEFEQKCGIDYNHTQTIDIFAPNPPPPFTSQAIAVCANYVFRASSGRLPP
jgi:hypothetical protein